MSPGGHITLLNAGYGGHMARYHLYVTPCEHNQGEFPPACPFTHQVSAAGPSEPKGTPF